MRKILPVALLFLAFSLSLLPAQAILEEPFLPMSPEVIAQGGSFIANATGYNSLFYNPAGFASPKGSLTVLSSTAWVYSNPLRLLQAMDNNGDPQALVGFIEDEITAGGFGVGLSSGVGYVGRGLGLGAVLNLDSYLWGPTALGAQGDMSATLAFIGGLAVPMNFFGAKLILGGDIRPLIRIRVPVDYTTIFSILDAIQTGGDPLAVLNSAEALYGFGFGIDLGAILELGNLKAGVTVRDFLGTRLAYNQSLFGDVITSLKETGGFPSDGTVVADHLIPMDISAGLAYRFNFGSFNRIIDPVLHASISDVIGVIRDQRSPWALLHIGAEVRLLRFLALRAGLNQGYLTVGGDVRLLFLDLNWALFTREMGRHLGDRPSSGLALEAALRL